MSFINVCYLCNITDLFGGGGGGVEGRGVLGGRGGGSIVCHTLYHLDDQVKEASGEV